MIVRSLDLNHDWTFGKGKNNYVKNNDAIIQNIDTRLLMFLGDCFFAVDQGVDWFNLLGSKNQVALELAIRAVILNTDGVTSIINSNVLLDSKTRRINLNYTVETIYTGIEQNVIAANSSSFILTEDGDVLSIEDGGGIEAG